MKKWLHFNLWILEIKREEGGKRRAVSAPFFHYVLLVSSNQMSLIIPNKTYTNEDFFYKPMPCLNRTSMSYEQGRIHGYPSRVRVGRGHI